MTERWEDNWEEAEISGRTLAVWRQLYELAQAGAPNVSLEDIPPEVLEKLETDTA